MTTDLGKNLTCAECGQQKCDCPERKNGRWEADDIEHVVLHNFYRPSQKSIEGYRERHAPLLHIVTEAKNGFFAPFKKAITAYRERREAKYQELSPSHKRRNLQWTIILIIGASLTVAQAHA